jgi:hypothetical protein
VGAVRSSGALVIAGAGGAASGGRSSLFYILFLSSFSFFSVLFCAVFIFDV